MPESAVVAGLLGVITTLCGAIGVLFYALREAGKRADAKHDAEIARMAAGSAALEASAEKQRAFYSEQAATSVRNAEAQREMSQALNRLSEAFDRYRSGTSFPAQRRP